MDPARKRKIRLVVALSAAVLLAGALVYVSFSSSSEAKEPSDLLAGAGAGSYEVTGTVVPGSVSHKGEELRFRLGDRDDLSESVPVRYRGTVPDPFREGREVILTGEYRDGTLVGDRDELITKCPSKFSEEAQQNPDQVMITTDQ
jgi:cytochrome c-type biogenesis protein CcmE